MSSSSRPYRTGMASLIAVVALALAAFGVTRLLSDSNSHTAARKLANRAPTDLHSSTKLSPASASTSRPVLFGPFGAHIIGGAAPSDYAWTQDLLTGSSTSSLQVVQPKLDASMSMSGARVLDDGSLVVLASQDLTPGVAREDGASAAGLAFPLIHMSTSGDVLSSHDIRVPGELVSLVGVSGTTAYLVRSSEPATGSSRVVAIDIASGQEQQVGSVSGGQPTAGDARGDEIALGSGPAVGSATERDCTVTQLRIKDGVTTTAPVPSCESVLGIQITPDGSSIAVAYSALADGQNEVRATTWSGRDGDAIAQGTHIGYAQPYGDRATVCRRGCPAEDPIDFAGLAWTSDSHSLLVGVITHPASGSVGEVHLPENLQIKTIGVS